MSTPQGLPAPLTLRTAWRRAINAMWSLEHAFERSRAADRPVDDTRLRIFFVLSLFALGFTAMGADAARKALWTHPNLGEFAAPAPAAARADLVDRQGRLLAVDLQHFGLYLDPREVWDAGETRRSLHRLLPQVPLERLDRALKGRRREYLLGALTPQQKEVVHDLGLPGVSFEEESKRVYPLGASAAHLLGFSDTAGRGLSGAELAFNGSITAAAKTGEPMQLAVDLRVQAALEDELRKGVAEFTPRGAVGVVTDVRTGEILALSSQPDFDPNAPGRGGPDGMLNRAAQSVYEMGSTFKLFTFAMALDSGSETMRSTFNAGQPLQIGARLIHDYHKGGPAILSMDDAFIMSSNISTAKMALHAGSDRLQDYFKRFGLFAPAKVELAEAARPFLPRTWDQSTTASASFGQAIMVSPLNVAAGVGALTNGGVFHPLTLRKRGPGEIAGGIPGSRRVVSPETSRLMLGLMRDNVVLEHGSGKQANALGLRVGGKTGSAQKVGAHGYDNSKNVSSFAAVFPTDGALDGPRYLVLVLFDEPHATPKTAGFITAGWNAAPVAGRVIDRIAPFLGVRRVASAPFAAAPSLTARAASRPGDEDAATGPL